MKILIVSDRNFYTSLGRTALHFYNALKEVYDTDILFFTSNKFFNTSKSKEIIKEYNYFHTNNYYLGALFKYKNKLKKIVYQYDLIILTHQFLGYLVDSSYSNKIVTMVHDIFSITWHKQNLKYYLLNNFLLKPVINSRAFIYNSNYTKNQFEKYFKIDKSSIVSYVVVDPQEVLHFKFNTDLSKRFQGKRVFLNIGLAEERKNSRIFIELAKHFKDDLFVRVGELLESEKRYTEGIKNLIILSNLSYNDILTLYSLAEYYILPSLDEGFSITGLEALLHNCKLIASNIEVHREIYKECANYVKDNCDVQSYIDVINSYKDIKKECVENLIKLYTLNSFEYRLINFIESLINSTI